MGLNIWITTEQGVCHADWDDSKMAGDRQFGDMAVDLPRVEYAGGSTFEAWELFRPADFDVWRAAIAAADLPNPDRWPLMLGILESDASYWIYLSW